MPFLSQTHSGAGSFMNIRWKGCMEKFWESQTVHGTCNDLAMIYARWVDWHTVVAYMCILHNLSEAIYLCGWKYLILRFVFTFCFQQTYNPCCHWWYHCLKICQRPVDQVRFQSKSSWRICWISASFWYWTLVPFETLGFLMARLILPKWKDWSVFILYMFIGLLIFA